MATLMTTEEHKTHLFDFLLKFYQDQTVRAALHQDSYNSGNMSRLQNSTCTRSASVSTCDTMICVECFRSKGDNELAVPCQNPRCHFYLQMPREHHQRFPSESISTSVSKPTASSSFCREVGHHRQRQNLPPHRSSRPVTKSTSSSIWAYQPEKQSLQVNRHSSQHKDTYQRMRSQSTSVNGRGEQLRMPRRGGANHYLPYQGLYAGEGSRSRLMSMPVSVEAFGTDQGSDLVEDAFLSSPLPDVGDCCTVGDEMKHRRLGTPDTDKDSGVSSPFGLSSFVDWMDQPPSTSTSSIPSVINSASPGHLSADMSFLSLKNSKCDLSGSVFVNSDSEECLSTERLHSPGECKRKLSQTNETFSRKVFIGGLPPDIDQDEIRTYFLRFGPVTVDWPHKNQNKGCIPPKGYAFLLFKDEPSVHKLLHACFSESDKYFIHIPTSPLARKKVQIRPWYISDSQYSIGNKSVTLDSRRAVFVGGVPRPLKAFELAEVMTEKYGTVAYVAIDCDSDLKYPKGAACVMFSTSTSYIAAVTARFMQLNYGSLDKKIEIKPYVLDGQECDECHGVQCNGKPAPFFCGTVTCLQYYCEYCWATVHSIPGRQNHRPLLKDIGDKARYY